MRNQIKQSLVDYLAKDGVDGYGQSKVLQPKAVFKDKTEEVLKWNEEHKLLAINTYGWAYGTYKGFRIGDINDADIKQSCTDAVRHNEVYKKAMTSW